MGTLLIENGHIFDPAEAIDGPGFVAVKDGLFAYVGSDRARAEAAIGRNAERYDAAGMHVFPGLVDMHVHLREPGNEAEETIASGAAAALAGGFTSIVAMANTDPPVDTEAAVTFVRREARRAAAANVFPVGCVTVGRQGKELAEMGQMARSGAVAFSDDGSVIPTAGLLRRALQYAAMLDLPILEHCEDPSLAEDGVMNEGFVSTVLGLPGIPSQAEDVIVARDAVVALLTGARLHLQHISTKMSVMILGMAKREAARVTAEVTPHHLVLTDEACRGYHPDFKVSPPLRGPADVVACRQGLADGTIDVIASDHAPHLAEEKELEFAAAPCGMIGLETTLGVVLTHLVATGEVPLAQVIRAMTSRPSDILRLGRGRLKEGLPGDVAVVDMEREWVVDPSTFVSHSRNCPYKGWKLKGRAVATVVGGKVLYRLGS